MYNVQKYIEKCIESVCNQTYTNWEMILIDDGSTDQTGEFAEILCKKINDNRIRLLHKVNGGLSDARNYGLDLITGEYVFFLDSDDYLSSDALAKMISYATSETIVIANVINKWANKESEVKFKEYGKFTSKNAIEKLFRCELPSYACNKLYPSHVWNDFRFPVHKNFEDVRTIFRVVEKVNSVTIIDEATYYYLQRSGSITDLSRENGMDAIDAYKEQLHYAKENNMDCVSNIEYRIEEVRARFLIRKDYKNRNLNDIANDIAPFRKAIFKNIGKLLRFQLEPDSKLRNIMALIMLISPSVYIRLYYFYSKRKRNIKLE